MNSHSSRKNQFILVLFFLAGFCGTSLQAQELKSEAEYQNYFDKRIDSLDQLEGIWNVTNIQQFYRYDTLYDVEKFSKGDHVAILKKGNHYDSFKISGESFHVEFGPSDVAGVYMYKNYYKETDSYSKANAVITRNGKMEISYEFPDKYLRYKFSDSYEEGTRVVNNTSWTRIYPKASKSK